MRLYFEFLDVQWSTQSPADGFGQKKRLFNQSYFKMKISASRRTIKNMAIF
jgi:hypothetical protein